MKSVYLLLLSATLGLVCCHPNNDSTPGGTDPVPATQNRPGSVRPIGEPLGAATSKSIGPEGGTIATPDGQVSLTIPAGALKSATTISIQPIKGTAPNKIGNGFRFSPDGQTFDKSITLKMAYEPDSLPSGQPQVLRIAYQNSKGVWQAVNGVTVDERAHTVSAPITHFSDWDLFESYSLVPMRSIIGYGEPVLINVNTALSLASLSSTGQEGELIEPVPVAEVSNWKLEGSGNLVPSGNQATYLAPKESPVKPNPVVISVDVKPATTKGKVILFARVKVMGDELELILNGAKYTMTTVSAMSYGKGYLIGGGSIEKNVSIEFMTLGNGGGFGDLQKSGQVNIGVGLGKNSYGCEYTECKKTAPGEYPEPSVQKFTTGSMTFTVSNGYVTGKFSGQVVNTKRTYCYDKPEFASISGSFRMKLL